jgi:hypothetical protein
MGLSSSVKESGIRERGKGSAIQFMISFRSVLSERLSPYIFSLSGASSLILGYSFATTGPMSKSTEPSDQISASCLL